MFDEMYSWPIQTTFYLLTWNNKFFFLWMLSKLAFVVWKLSRKDYKSKIMIWNVKYYFLIWIFFHNIFEYQIMIKNMPGTDIFILTFLGCCRKSPPPLCYDIFTICRVYNWNNGEKESDLQFNKQSTLTT